MIAFGVMTEVDVGFGKQRVAAMSRINLSAAWLLGALITVACSSSDGSDGSKSSSNGSAANPIEESSDIAGVTSSGGANGSSADGSVVLDGAGGADSSSSGGAGTVENATGGAPEASAGTPGSGIVESTGGTTSTEPASSGGDSGVTTDPGQTQSGGDNGTTTDPPPETTGGTTGETMDPPLGETEDPPIGETEDPPIGETEDPPDGETEDPPDGETEDPPPVDECVPTEMTDINVIVFNDAEPGGADSEGRMYVGGNAVFDGYAIASQEEDDCNSWGLVVGGDLTASGGSVGSGKIAVGGTFTRDGAFTAPCGVWEGEEPVDFEALEARMIAYSEAMKAYPENGESEVSGGYLNLTGTDPELNVFSVTAEELNNNFRLDVPEGSSVIVNVSGEEVFWSGVGFDLPDGASCRGGSSDWCHSIMFNLYEAITLDLSGIGVQGSVLAPYATFSGGGGNVDGQLIVQNLYGGIEFHPYFFSGCLLLPEVEQDTGA